MTTVTMTEDDLIALSRRYVQDRLLAPWGHLIPRDEHDDYFQSAFEYLWERRHTFDPERGSKGNWVYTVLGYWLKSRFNERSKWRGPELDDLIPVSPLPEAEAGEGLGEMSPLEAMVNGPLWSEPEHELSPLVEEMLDDLEGELIARQKMVAKGRNTQGERKPKLVRRAVELHLAYGAVARDAADHLGISDRSVTRYVREAREILRDRWSERLQEEGRLAA